MSFEKVSYIHVDLDTISLLFGKRTEDRIIIEDTSQSTINSDRYERVRDYIHSGYFNCQWYINLAANTQLFNYFQDEIQEEFISIHSLTPSEGEETAFKLANDVLNNAVKFKSKRDRKKFGALLKEAKDSRVKNELIPLLTFIKRVLWVPNYDWSDFADAAGATGGLYSQSGRKIRPMWDI